MPDLRTGSWAEFTRTVATAVQAGDNVTIRADNLDGYAATIEKGTEEETPWETHG